MKNFFLLFCLFVFGSLEAGEVYRIRPRSYFLSTYFDIDAEEKQMYTVEKHTLQLRSTYTLYGETGELAVGIARLWSAGSLMNRMKELDFYDQGGALIGKLVGTIWTTSSAKFALYNAAEEHVATAYLDTSCATFSVVDPMREEALLARFDRTFVPKGDYFWDVSMKESTFLDTRILHILSAFVADAFWPSELNPNHYFHEQANGF